MKEDRFLFLGKVRNIKPKPWVKIKQEHKKKEKGDIPSIENG